MMTESNAHHEAHLHMLQRQLIILERNKKPTPDEAVKMNKLKDEITMERSQLRRARELHLPGYDEEVLV